MAKIAGLGGSPVVQGRWSEFTAGLKTGAQGANISSLVQSVLRDSYLETNKDLQFYAEKVRFYNDLKSAIRDELTRMRKLQAELAPYWNEDGSAKLGEMMDQAPPDHTEGDGSSYSGQNNPDWGDSQDGQGGLRRWADEQLRPGWGSGGVGEFSDFPGPDGEVVMTRGKAADKWWTPGGKDRIEAAVKGLEERLASVGDDAQLANIDLQNQLQKQQQTLQTMSNVSKMLHDTAMAIIRKIG